MNKTKYKFFEQINIAITKPMQYFRLTKISGGRLIGFIFLFVLITNLFYAIPTIYETVGPNGLTAYLHDKLPSFQFSDGQLNMEKPYEYEDGMIHVRIDTSVDKFTKDDINDQYVLDYLISKSNVIIYEYGIKQEMNLTYLRGFHFDNKILNPIISISLIFELIMSYIGDMISYLVAALLFSLVGLITAIATKVKVKYGKIFRTAIYGQVTASLLSALYSVFVMVTSLRISALTVFGITILINCAYVVYGTMSHNLDDTQEETKEDNLSQNYFSGQ